MGMESFSITATPTSVKIIREKEYWKLKGKSDVFIKKVEDFFIKKNLIRGSGNNWEYDSCIEIVVLGENGFFQGLEMKGCLSYFDLGVKVCCELIKEMSLDLIELQIFVLNELIEADFNDDLVCKIKSMYKNKLDIFNKQYNNIVLKVTCGDFYNEIKRRSKWYYKLFHKR